MTSSPPRSLLSLSPRLRSCGLALAAAVGCILASAARAQIVYSGVQNLRASAANVPLAMDFNSDGVVDLGEIGRFSTGSFTHSSSLTETGQVVTGASGSAAEFSAGTVISSASQFSAMTSSSTTVFSGTGSMAPTAVWRTLSSDGYIGFSFISGGNTYYGWAEFSTPAAATGVVTLVDWAYNSLPGQSIVTGQIPEPATAALGAGVVTLGGALWLKRRWRRLPQHASSAAPASAAVPVADV